MTSTFQNASGDARRHFTPASGRFENRQPSNRSTPCKNGPLCRKYQEGTCPYSHDFSNLSMNGNSNQKKSFNVDSPAFTPRSPSSAPAQVQLQSTRQTSIAPGAAAAAFFTPRGSGAVTPAASSQTKAAPAFVPQQQYQPQQSFQEFVPQNFVPQPLQILTGKERIGEAIDLPGDHWM